MERLQQGLWKGLVLGSNAPEAEVFGMEGFPMLSLLGCPLTTPSRKIGFQQGTAGRDVKQTNRKIPKP